MNLDQLMLENPLMLTIKLSRFKFVAKLLNENDHVLDVGCGKGQSTTFFSKYCRKIHGIDISAEKIDYAKKYNAGNFTTYEVLDATFLKDGISDFYDVIVLLDFIEHLDKNNGKQVLIECTGKLKNSGFVIIGTPNINFAHLRSEISKSVHKYEYSPFEFRRMLQPVFNRVIYFSMNDEVVHTGNLETSWFLWAVCFL